jgi:hypothetical protein
MDMARGSHSLLGDKGIGQDGNADIESREFIHLKFHPFSREQARERTQKFLVLFLRESPLY